MQDDIQRRQTHGAAFVDSSVVQRPPASNIVTIVVKYCTDSLTLTVNVNPTSNSNPYSYHALIYLPGKQMV
jgi:hypothetical protein